MKVVAILKGKDPQPFTHIKEVIATLKEMKNGRNSRNPKISHPRSA